MVISNDSLAYKGCSFCKLCFLSLNLLRSVLVSDGSGTLSLFKNCSYNLQQTIFQY